MDPDQVATESLHCIHVLLDLFITGHARLIQNSVEVYLLTVQIDSAPTGFYFAKAKVGLDFRGITVLINKLCDKTIKMWIFGRPQLCIWNLQYQSLLFLPRLKRQSEFICSNRAGILLRPVINIKSDLVYTGIMYSGC